MADTSSKCRYMLYLSVDAYGDFMPGGSSGPGLVCCRMEQLVNSKTYNSAAVPGYGHLLKK